MGTLESSSLLFYKGPPPAVATVVSEMAHESLPNSGLHVGSLKSVTVRVFMGLFPTLDFTLGA